MKKLFVLIAILAVSVPVVLLAGCRMTTIRASGVMVEGEFALSRQVTEIRFAFPARLNIDNSNNNLLTYYVDDNLQEHLNIRLSNTGVLTDELARRIGVNMTNSRGAVFNVGAAGLRYLRLSGAAVAVASGNFSAGNNFELSLSGASQARGFDVTAQDVRVTLSGASRVEDSEFEAGRNLRVDVSGASRFTASGEANSLIINASGASNVQAGELTAVSGNVRASGASNVTVSVSGNLNQSTSGGSRITNIGCLVC